MELTIFGPNLDSAKQQRGDLHVHAKGCGDCRKYRGDESSHCTASTYQEVVEFIYSDHMGDEDSPWTDYENSFHWAPCTRDLDQLADRRALQSLIVSARQLVCQLESVASDEDQMSPGEDRESIVQGGITRAAWTVYHLNDEVRAAAFARGCTK